MDKTEIIKILKGIEFFSSMESDFFEDMYSVSNTLSLNRGSVIFNEDEEADALYIILSGSVRIYKQFPDKSRKFIEKREVSQIFGEMAIFNDKPRSATAVTDRDTVLLEIPRQKFSRLVEDNAHFWKSITEFLSYRLRYTNISMVDDLQEKNVQLKKALRDLKENVDLLIATTREKEAVESELRIARKIQESLLPGQFLPDSSIRPVEISAVNIPSMYVGGDYYDYINIDDDRIFLLVGDVSGKGTSACFYMALLKGILTGILNKGSGLDDIVIKLNRHLYENTPKEVFITAIFGIIDKKTMQFTFVRSGHCPLLYYNSLLNSSELLTPKGIMLGALKNIGGLFEKECISLNSADIILMFTDGVSEAMNGEGCLYGDERISCIVKSLHSEPVSRIIDKLVSDINVFRGEHPQNDDITIMAMKI